MTEETDHNKLLKKIAKERLKPHGIFQQGQSRSFLFDRGWFTIVIEFQPSSWSKGTYLNIGVDFNFYPRDYFAFRYGYREKGFEKFKDAEQFSSLVNDLCDLTIKRVQELDLKFKDIWTALKTVEREKETDTWTLYELAVLNALTGNYDKALKQFNQVANLKCESDWEIQRNQVAQELITSLKDKSKVLNDIKNIITKTRQLKKLPNVTLDDLTERKTASDSNGANGQSWFNKFFRSR
jgi:hypothetical protein